MRLAIMQPYFLPYIGYFQLINCADEFILFDTPQFIRHGWIERNSLIQIDGNKFYIQVPLVKSGRDTIIKDKVINNNSDWKLKILAQMTHYKKKAPFYCETLEVINEIFKTDKDSITLLNKNGIIKVCEYLDIRTRIKIWSEMNISFDGATSPDEWALNICKLLNANEYINPIGGLEFFDTTKYKNDGISISFLKSQNHVY